MKCSCATYCEAAVQLKEIAGRARNDELEMLNQSRVGARDDVVQHDGGNEMPDQVRHDGMTGGKVEEIINYICCK